MRHRARSRGSSESLFRKVLEIGQALRADGVIAQAHSDLGDVQLDRGDIDGAEAMQRTALAIFETRGDQAGVAGVWHSLGNVYRARGDPAQAEAWIAARALDRPRGRTVTSTIWSTATSARRHCLPSRRLT